MSSVAPDNSQPSQPIQPSLNVVAQYIKDFSFENPRAPQSLAPKEGAPSITVNVNVIPRQRGGGEFEVDLKLEAKASFGADVLFAVDLTYGGLFRVNNVPEQHLHAFVMIECPRLLFPFARQVVADATRNGGFMPLMIDPIDFVALYQQYLQRMAAQAQAAQQQQAPN